MDKTNKCKIALSLYNQWHESDQRRTVPFRTWLIGNINIPDPKKDKFITTRDNDRGGTGHGDMSHSDADPGL